MERNIAETTEQPVLRELPWVTEVGGLVCPACPDHRGPSSADEARFELVMELHEGGGNGSPEAVRVTRRAPDWGSGPFDLDRLPDGGRAVAMIDYLERQTFDRRAIERLLDELGTRYPDARMHVWRIPADVSLCIAEDAYWAEEPRTLLRAPVVDISPSEYPMDVGWRLHPDQVSGPDGGEISLYRGCLYVCPDNERLVRYGWSGLEKESKQGTRG